MRMKIEWNQISSNKWKVNKNNKNIPISILDFTSSLTIHSGCDNSLNGSISSYSLNHIIWWKKRDFVWDEFNAWPTAFGLSNSSLENIYSCELKLISSDFHRLCNIVETNYISFYLHEMNKGTNISFTLNQLTWREDRRFIRKSRNNYGMLRFCESFFFVKSEILKEF